MDRPWAIYALSDPQSGEVRYVGWTINLRQRLRDHLKPSRIAGTQHRDKWIASLISRGLTPAVAILEEDVGGGWAEAERRWIAHYRAASPNMTNHTDGGEGALGRAHSKEARQRMSEKRKGRKPSPKAIEATKALHSGVPLAFEHRAKISAALSGRRMTAEHKAAISAARVGMKISEEGRAKLRVAARARQPIMISERGKEAIRIAAQRPERRAKIAAAKKLWWDQKKGLANG